MVANATSFSRSGLSDWIIQRFSAVILAAYTLFILAVLGATPELDYESWQGSSARILCACLASSHCLRFADTPGSGCGRLEPTT